MANPFPLPAGLLESNWTAKEHQQAANHYYYESQGYNETAYQNGECDANYKPLQSMMLAEFRRHTRYAQQKRAGIA